MNTAVEQVPAAELPPRVASVKCHQSIGNDEISKHIAPHIDYISQSNTEALLAFINNTWAPTFTQLRHLFPWWGVLHGVIAPMLRIDMIPVRGQKSPSQIARRVFEVETNPEGFHALFAAHEYLENREHTAGTPGIIGDREIAELTQTFASLDCKGFLSLNSDIQSDSYIAKKLGLIYSINPTAQKQHGGSWWVRTPHISDHFLNDEEYETLSSYSVVDLYGDSRKDYLVNLGLAKLLSDAIDDGISYTDGFCIKPVFGTRSKNTSVLRPNADAQTIQLMKDTVAAIATFGAPSDYIIMPYIAAERRSLNVDTLYDDYEVIWRIYLRFNPETHQYDFFGGITTANPYTLVAEPLHGTKKEAYFWAVLKR